MRAEGTNCPACGKDIGLWAVMKLGWPNLGLKCPHCRTRLKYQPAGFGFLALSAAVYVPLAFVVLLMVRPSFAEQRSIGFVVWIILCFILWQPFELFIAHRLRNTAKLVPK